MKNHTNNSTSTLSRCARLVGLTLAMVLVTTVAARSQPAAPLLATPVDSSINQPQAPTFVWNISTGAVTYRLQVSSSADFSTTAYNDSTLTGTSQLVTGLALNTTYFWRVNAKNAGGTSAYSTTSRFITWTSIPTGPLAVDLLSNSTFAILAYSAITSAPASAVNGNAGVSPAAGSFLGLTQAQVTGTMYTVDATGPAGSVVAPTLLTQAMGDLTIAYNDAAGRTVNPIGLAGNLGGQTLYPGLYKSTGFLEITSGDLTLDANGNSNSVWIFQIASNFNMTSGRQVFLTNGAKASNIFWQVGSAATFGTTCVMKGTVMAGTQITMATGATLEGRALAMTANVTLQANSVTMPASATAVDKVSIPGKFSLSQNYPNPFNPTTNIQYSIQTASTVSLKVYNVLGNEVATLVNGHQEPGNYSVQFGSNRGAYSLSSGVYFYRIQAGSFLETKKLVLLK